MTDGSAATKPIRHAGIARLFPRLRIRITFGAPQALASSPSWMQRSYASSVTTVRP